MSGVEKQLQCGCSVKIYPCYVITKDPIYSSSLLSFQPYKKPQSCYKTSQTQSMQCYTKSHRHKLGTFNILKWSF